MRTQKSQRIANNSSNLNLANAKVTFEHLQSELTHYKQQFETEQNLKNNLYAFVLQTYGFAILIKKNIHSQFKN